MTEVTAGRPANERVMRGGGSLQTGRCVNSDDLGSGRSRADVEFFRNLLVSCGRHCRSGLTVGERAREPEAPRRHPADAAPSRIS